MERISRMKRSIDNSAKMAGLVSAGLLVAIMILCGGCQALIGAGRDVADAAEWSHRAIQSQLAQPSGRDRRPARSVDGAWTIGDMR